MDFLLNSEQFVQLVCRQHVQVGNVVPCLIGALEPFVVFFLEEEAPKLLAFLVRGGGVPGP